MMSLIQHSRRAGLALALAIGLTLITTVASPLLSDELAKVLPGVTTVLADEPSDSGG